MTFYQDRYITLDGKASTGLFYIKSREEQLLNKTVSTQSIPNSYGEKVKSIKYNSKTIKYKILFTIEQLADANITNVHDLKRLVAYYFDSTEEKKLWDSKDPNIYCNVLYQGTSEPEFLGDETAQTEVELLIPDGLHYSVIEKEITPSVNEDGILEAVVNSSGTALSNFRVESTFNADNGYFGVVSQNGVMEFGKRDEADGETLEKSVVLAVNKKGNFSDWTNGTIFYENQNKKVATTMTSDTQYGGRLGILSSGFTNTTNSQYFGAMKEKVLNETATNWYLYANAWYETGLMGQTGGWTFAVIDKNNHLIAGMALEKNDKVGNSATVSFLVGNNAGGSRVIKSIKFTPSYWVKNNPYGDEARQQNRNMWDIKKEGSTVRFFYYGKYYTYQLPDLATTEASRLQFFIGQYKGRTTVLKQFVSRMNLNNLTFTKTKVPYWKDNPNRYGEGDILRIDTATKTPTLNNLERFSDQLKGTEYFKLPYGETKIQFYYSDFSVPDPTVKIYLREAFI